VNVLRRNIPSCVRAIVLQLHIASHSVRAFGLAGQNALSRRASASGSIVRDFQAGKRTPAKALHGLMDKNPRPPGQPHHRPENCNHGQQTAAKAQRQNQIKRPFSKAHIGRPPKARMGRGGSKGPLNFREMP